MPEESRYRQPDERKREVLRILAGMSDGATPRELATDLDISKLYAAVLLSQYKRQGIILKRETPHGCRYCLSDKGKRKLAYIESREPGVDTG